MVGGIEKICLLLIVYYKFNYNDVYVCLLSVCCIVFANVYFSYLQCLDLISIHFRLTPPFLYTECVLKVLLVGGALVLNLDRYQILVNFSLLFTIIT